MIGIDKIIDRIAGDSAAKCEDILAAAKEQAEAAKAEAVAQAKESRHTAIAAAQQKTQSDIAASGSRIAQGEKRALLQMKNEVIQQAIASALARLKGLPTAAYFDMLARLAASTQAGQGEMLLSQGDLDRLPADFAGKLGGIRIAPGPADISGGFILVSGEVEYNCTFDALAADRLDDIKDALHAFIFT